MTDRDQAFRVWLTVGIAMLLAGSFFTSRTAGFLRTARHAQGTIVSRDPNWGSCRFSSLSNTMVGETSPGSANA
jgi:hypothetical protein